MTTAKSSPPPRQRSPLLPHHYAPTGSGDGISGASHAAPATQAAYINSAHPLERPSRIWQTPPTSTSDSSESDNTVDAPRAATPLDSPDQIESAALATQTGFGRLSLDNDRSKVARQPRRERSPSETWSHSSPKRVRTSLAVPAHVETKTANSSASPSQPSIPSQVHYEDVQLQSSPNNLQKRKSYPPPLDAGHRASRNSANAHGRNNKSLRCMHKQPLHETFCSHQRPPSTNLVGHTQHVKGKALEQLNPSESSPNQMLREPKSASITQEDLAIEVHNIYASLVVVEKKCIKIDAAQVGGKAVELGPEQNQALVGLHRKLLYEHHDFMMATQHPSATDSIRALPGKHSMPARMWKHGIHSFLEILRHRRPSSQEHMMEFIYLAYQMMALLFETVPVFVNTWVECLGDLARYRMAIEENKEIHSDWGSVATHWYSLGADYNPEIGRLFHHLGILERPSLRKLHLYTKSLTCVYRFPNAMDSLRTLFGPIVSDDLAGKGPQSPEARVVTCLAHVFSDSPSAVIDSVSKQAVMKLDRLPRSKAGELGVFVVTTTIAWLFQLGDENNLLWQAYSEITHKTRPTTNAPFSLAEPVLKSSSQAAVNSINHGVNSMTRTGPAALNSSALPATSASPAVLDFSYKCFNSLIWLHTDEGDLRSTLPSVHSVLIWLHSLHILKDFTTQDSYADMYATLTSPARFNWGRLSEYLDALVRDQPIKPHVLEGARRGRPIFLIAKNNSGRSAAARHDAEEPPINRPLPEDYEIRGLIWARFYFPPGCFTSIENDPDPGLHNDLAAHLDRVDRVQWLGLFLAFHTEHLTFDCRTQHFMASSPAGSVQTLKPLSQAPSTTVQPHNRLPSFPTVVARVPPTPAVTHEPASNRLVTKDLTRHAPTHQPQEAQLGKPWASTIVDLPQKQDDMEVRILNQDSFYDENVGLED